MAHDFSLSNEKLVFTTGQFTGKSLDIIEKKLKDLIKTFNRLAEEDSAFPLKERRSTGLFIAFRPWVFSLISGLRRVKRRES